MLRKLCDWYIGKYTEPKAGQTWRLINYDSEIIIISREDWAVMYRLKSMSDDPKCNHVMSIKYLRWIFRYKNG